MGSKQSTVADFHKKIREISTKYFPPSDGLPVGTMGKLTWQHGVECHCYMRFDPLLNVDVESGERTYWLEFKSKANEKQHLMAFDQILFVSKSFEQISSLIDLLAEFVTVHGATAIREIVASYKMELPKKT